MMQDMFYTRLLQSEHIPSVNMSNNMERVSHWTVTKGHTFH